MSEASGQNPEWNEQFEFYVQGTEAFRNDVPRVVVVNVLSFPNSLCPSSAEKTRRYFTLPSLQVIIFSVWDMDASGVEDQAQLWSDYD